MSVTGIAAVARQLEAEARARVQQVATDGAREINGISAAFDLHDAKCWNTAAVVAVAGVLLRLSPDLGAELAYAAVVEWHRARGGEVVEADDIGEERGTA